MFHPNMYEAKDSKNQNRNRGTHCRAPSYPMELPPCAASGRRRVLAGNDLGHPPPQCLGWL
jgi:hypothetical protein